ncbi:MAG: SprB repeat-containing protein, partial [Phaeodactylibacter sp.]|nr:SprB repeat-containing protein [Phaeodactylibacter sp.]
CDSVRVLNLMVLPAITTTFEISICDGESYEGYTETGVYSDTYITAGGCDSTRVLNLTVLPTLYSSINAQVCEGEEYEGYTMSGVYTDIFTAYNGCDSIRTLELEVLPAFSTQVNRTICAGEEYQGYSQTGVYTDAYTAANGCDSIRILNLMVVPAIDTVQIEQFSCDSTALGVFTETLASQDGCDSTVVTTVLFAPIEPNLEVQPASIGANNGSASVSPTGGQAPYTIQWSNGSTGTPISGLAPGAYSVRVSDATGCSVTLDFEIEQVSNLREIPSLEYFNLFPNPASQHVYLEWQFSLWEEGVLIVQDFLGREVHRETFRGKAHHTEIGIEQLPAGVYQARLIVNKGEVAKFLAVQH